MAVKIRMTRMGRRHRPFFRINAVDGRTPRDGRILEKLGHYDPIEKDPAKQVVINIERVKHWLDLGAIPSDTVSEILAKCGLKNKHAEAKALRRERAKAQARAKGKFFNKAEKIAAEKAEELKAAELKAAEEKAAADKAAAEKAAEEKAAAEKAAEEATAAEAPDESEAQAPADSEAEPEDKS
jgi:small subunit ribosomal protein S16